MTGRRALTVAVVGCIAAGLLLVVAAGRPWGVISLHGPVPQTRDISGRAHTEVPYALGWLGAAAGLALLATRGWARTIIGAVLVLAGVAAAVESVRWAGRRAEDGWFSYGPVTSVGTSHTAWPWVAAASGAVLAGIAFWVTLRGRSWPAMGRRYDAPTARPRPAEPEAAAWDALDRGDDPTA